ncbi:hypothetical protein HPB47_018155 [Ixodes persulcatus]|uniref:Uncharacterized protein n=1 Tax=Ixodes persulcatus TaxID=34615 RepID=A0AC60QMG0_IXOPE|nr:hypothetical protein HPB47_018155 [Ixodes persulcatus]
MGARGHSMFIKEATKLVFGRENLHGQSMTGVPCWRFKGAMAKRALTPSKLAAVRSAIQSRAQGCSVDAMEKQLAGRGNKVKKTDTPLVAPTAFDDEGHSG